MHSGGIKRFVRLVDGLLTVCKEPFFTTVPGEINGNQAQKEASGDLQPSANPGLLETAPACSKICKKKNIGIWKFAKIAFEARWTKKNPLDVYWKSDELHIFPMVAVNFHLPGTASRNHRRWRPWQRTRPLSPWHHLQVQAIGKKTKNVGPILGATLW